MLLERRLDNVVYRLGFVTSRNEARQLIRHRHFRVNGKLVDIPSYILNPSDTIEPKEKSKSMARIVESSSPSSGGACRDGFELDKQQLKGRLSELPAREEITIHAIQEQLIVELLSRQM